MLIESLQNPSLYEHEVEEFQVLETHISWVLLTGPYAYKLKKPVDLGFVNFTTLELRERYCHEEIRLNRRLAPDLYLKVIPITGIEEAPELDGTGEIIDYAVQMVQFSQESLLSKAIAEDRLTAEHIDQLAEEVAEFHARIAVAGSDQPYGTPEKVMAPVKENFRHLDELYADDRDVVEMVEQIRAENERWHRSAEGILAERKSQGFIRECHGDMHLGNMILSERGVTIFDCLEFNTDLRWTDVMSEVAFVVMDLSDRGRPDFAMRFLNRYLELTGDYAGVPLLRFYLSYRAMVRAKVAALRLSQHEFSPAETEQIRGEFWSYLQLAKQYATKTEPTLILTHGVSGSGKSFGTSLLLEGMEAIRVRSDVERKRLQAEREIPDERLYTSEVTEQTYQRLVELAQTILQAGWTAIVDATTLQVWQRSLFRDLAEQLQVRFVLLCFEADQGVLEARIQKRLEAEQDPSDATLDVLQLQLTAREALTAEEQTVSVVLPAGQEWTTEMLVQLVTDVCQADD
ncbi:Phosphotransferase enzyme family protein [Gimesia panareensis]|uniref:Phosphotransferase enzyme family protein n=1 Tax=Gimesia panareensis TaxID=2527978 RepID=A0A518FJD5_9PLAN|nr:bifunctional aminoglycoside phosphotransferase/ATP-binding protein [Gimesia panareensis]QDV16476.1 Phosphotransferase enzyme family protein [Gimesia panareensis]